MIIQIILEGNTYTSPDTDETTADEFSEQIFERMADLDRFKLELDTGGYLVIGKDAVQRAQVIVK